jgi:thiol-disulfide isomerase/thioredoxin
MQLHEKGTFRLQERQLQKLDLVTLVRFFSVIYFVRSVLFSSYSNKSKLLLEKKRKMTNDSSVGSSTATTTQNGYQNDRILHVIQVPNNQPASVFTPWNLFVFISIGLFLAYLYYSYTNSLTMKLDERESPFVTEVTSPEVSSSVLAGDGTTKVVLMYATWCEHCRIMMPAFNAAAESTRQIRWLKVEQANAAPILKTRTDIRGFPTIFGVKSSGEVIQYGEREPRTEDALKKWALQLISNSPTNLNAKTQDAPVSATPNPTPTPTNNPVPEPSPNPVPVPALSSPGPLSPPSFIPVSVTLDMPVVVPNLNKVEDAEINVEGGVDE